MVNKSSLLIVFLISIIFYGCSTKSSYSAYNQDISFPLKSYNSSAKNISYDELYNALNLQHKDWKGVRYKYGGNSKKGIDCSSFVQKTFKDRLNINIPRTTTLQSKTGIDISMKDLEIGDLVFFKTGFNSKHVGIYLEAGKFLHASTRRGVTISRLDNNYYSKNFWKIKRVIY